MGPGKDTSLNNSINVSTGLSPNQVIYGFQLNEGLPALPVGNVTDVDDASLKAQPPTSVQDARVQDAYVDDASLKAQPPTSVQDARVQDAHVDFLDTRNRLRQEAADSIAFAAARMKLRFDKIRAPLQL
ncbi:hypothetical protein BU16DRAFT_568031 [Lophium mytilinum]|uniref:Uncharacterized protein n=1 Tax=Lophium mytilinum TaxID=390894 RepID=A0A6A6Q9N8_9PEZI|nr:hypothetical protein BU16DRAFT_568031 [Lophium mytilinum]